MRTLNGQHYSFGGEHHPPSAFLESVPPVDFPHVQLGTPLLACSHLLYNVHLNNQGEVLLEYPLDGIFVHLIH